VPVEYFETEEEGQAHIRAMEEAAARIFQQERDELDECMRSFRNKLREGITVHFQKPSLMEKNEPIFVDATFLTADQLEAVYLLQHGYSTLSPCSNKNIPHETIENRIHVGPGVALASRGNKANKKPKIRE
jgi:hypothetical protein